MMVVGRAHDSAVSRGSTETGAEDVVLAVLTQMDVGVNPSLRSLAGALSAGASPTSTTAIVDGSPDAPDPDQLGRPTQSAFADRIPNQRLPFAESAIATFRAAWKKAKWDGRKRVDEYDLLTAAIEQPALAAARSAAGIDLDAVRAVISGLRQSR